MGNLARCGSNNGCQKDMFKRDWTVCSEYDDHSRLNCQHKYGGSICPLDERENFTLILHKDTHLSSKTHQESNYGLDFDLLKNTTKNFHTSCNTFKINSVTYIYTYVWLRKTILFTCWWSPTTFDKVYLNVLFGVSCLRVQSSFL